MKPDGSGRTTQQMKEAPPYSVFVWCDENLFYPKVIAERLGRGDLLIISPHQLETGYLRGRKLLAITVDHAAQLTNRQHDALMRDLKGDRP